MTDWRQRALAAERQLDEIEALHAEWKAAKTAPSVPKVRMSHRKRLEFTQAYYARIDQAHRALFAWRRTA